MMEQYYSTNPGSAEKGKQKHCFTCLLCGLKRSTRQRIYSHLSCSHGKGPIPRIRKQYLDDPSIPVPKRTRMRMSASSLPSYTSPVTCREQIQEHVIFDEDTQLQEDGEQPQMSLNPTAFDMQADVPHDDTSDCETISSIASSSDESDTSSYRSDSDNSLIEDDIDAENVCDFSVAHPTEQDVQSLAVLSYIQKHNLTAVAGDDLLELIKIICPNIPQSSGKYKDMLGQLSNNSPKLIHYCSECYKAFPEDPDLYICSGEHCSGLRYKGSETAQNMPTRKPKCFFVIADISSQATCILEKPGVWEAIKSTKQHIQITADTDVALSDITDGQCYRDLASSGQFLDPTKGNISFTGNTDGVPLFQSTGCKLWPIFLVINELPASQRMARENTILAGLWQGKGNPPFFAYISALGEALTLLGEKGIQLKPPGSAENIISKSILLLTTVDLQAKAYIANMTAHNGAYGCITCEEPGMAVHQGKGYARCYPYCEQGAPLRDSDDILQNKAPIASAKKRQMGIIGPSAFATIPHFDLVKGMVPDYMHGVLLGVTKTLLRLWFSPTNSRKPYYIGKHIKAVSKRLCSITPPDYVIRLPRDLEKHYLHLKANELQAWLLHYSLPCLNGYLPNEYLVHFAFLSEGIHILLSDGIVDNDIKRADYLFDKFYKDFEGLYGQGSCGLNVHNIGKHLVMYVRWWGPLYGWSCFGFEDANSKLLKSAFGTGDVTNQIILKQQTSLCIAGLDMCKLPSGPAKNFISEMQSRYSKQWKGLQQGQNCMIAGALHPLSKDESDVAFIMCHCESNNINLLKKCLRVKVGMDKFYCKEYTRLHKHACHYILCSDGSMMDTEYFVLNTETEKVYGVGKSIDVQDESPFLLKEGGHHIFRVKSTDDSVVRGAELFLEKLFFIDTGGCQFVSKVPNHFGYGVLK